MITNTSGVTIFGYESAYCPATGKLTAARKTGPGRYVCSGCGAELRLVDTDPPAERRLAA